MLCCSHVGVTIVPFLCCSGSRVDLSTLDVSTGKSDPYKLCGVDCENNLYLVNDRNQNVNMFDASRVWKLDSDGKHITPYKTDFNKLTTPEGPISTLSLIIDKNGYYHGLGYIITQNYENRFFIYYTNISGQFVYHIIRDSNGNGVDRDDTMDPVNYRTAMYIDENGKADIVIGLNKIGKYMRCHGSNESEFQSTWCSVNSTKNFTEPKYNSTGKIYIYYVDFDPNGNLIVVVQKEDGFYRDIFYLMYKKKRLYYLMNTSNHSFGEWEYKYMFETTAPDRNGAFDEHPSSFFNVLDSGVLGIAARKDTNDRNYIRYSSATFDGTSYIEHNDYVLENLYMENGSYDEEYTAYIHPDHTLGFCTKEEDIDPESPTKYSE